MSMDWLMVMFADEDFTSCQYTHNGGVPKLYKSRAISDTSTRVTFWFCIQTSQDLLQREGLKFSPKY